MDAVTPEALGELASSYIHPDTALVVLVGDRASFEDSVKKWGKVEIVER